LVSIFFSIDKIETMKTILFTSILLFVYSESLLAQQPMQFTFSAQNSSQYIQLDSITIENISQGGDTILFYPDTILVLDYIIGIDNSKIIETNEFYLSQNYPNPIIEKTSFNIWMPQKGKLSIVVYDLAGRELLNYNSYLNQGKHSFLFVSGQENFYLLIANVNGIQKTIKMINLPGYSSIEGYCSLEYTDKKNYVPRYKTTDLLNDFVFNPGDLLLYTAYADSGERKISDKPLADRSYTFQYSGIPCHEEPFVTDSDGNVYNTVIIGNQCWMKENLKTTTYNDGTPIPNVEDSSWVNITHGVYCWYDNNFYWSYPYGALYNWYTVEDTTRICPEGWHVPTLNEFQVLKAQSSGLYSHGISLKSCRQVNYFNGLCNTSEHPRWEEHNENHGVDEFGFSGLPGGIRFIDGAFL